MLLDSLRFVTLSTLRNGVVSRLKTLAESRELATPAVLIPERSLQDFGVSSERRPSVVAYQDFHPGEKTSVTSGSVGFIGGILRDFPGIRRHTDGDATWIAPDATLADLRDQHCRSMVIVTDYMGSGSQVHALAAAIARHPTVRSWRSLHLLDIHVVTFAASPNAVKRLRASKIVGNIWTVEAAPTFETASWTPVVRNAIIDLCRVECRTQQRYALGFGGSAGLFAMERGAPNNLPAVFWQTTAGWKPLFPNRTVPVAFARELVEYRKSDSLGELAERIGQLRLGRNRRLAHMRPASRVLLQALLIISRGPKNGVVLAAQLGIDVADADVLLECLKRLRLIDRTGAITDAGRAEITADKRARRQTTADLHGSSDTYYPYSLR
jgi:hypothetical protein